MLNALQVKFDCREVNEGGRFLECIRLTAAYLSTKLEGGGDVETSIRNEKVFDPAWTDPVRPNPAAMKSMIQAEYGTRAKRVEKLRINLRTAYGLVIGQLFHPLCSGSVFRQYHGLHGRRVWSDRVWPCWLKYFPVPNRRFDVAAAFKLHAQVCRRMPYTFRESSPLVPFPTVELDLQRVQRLACPSKSFPPNVVPASKSLSSLVCVQRRLLFAFYIEPPHFSGRSTRSKGNSLIYVDTTSFHGDSHAVETMYAISQALSLPVKIYLDKIDKLGNYESILP